MSSMGLKAIENSIKLYADGCFKEACEILSRDYSVDLYTFEYIMVKNSAGVYQLHPKVWCKYGVVTKVAMRGFKKGLYKYFGIKFGNTREMRCSLDRGTFDINYTKGIFKDSKDVNINLNIFDSNTDPNKGGLRGSCMVSGTYEKLLFGYYELDSESYSALGEDDERQYLPCSITEDWDEYQNLYEKVFGRRVGEEYDIVSSSGLKGV